MKLQVNEIDEVRSGKDRYEVANEWDRWNYIEVNKIEMKF